jgi:hypothetical protein
MFSKEFWRRRSLRTPDDKREKPEITLRESIYPIFLVTILFFLWGFSYGLLDTLNKHFQNTLGITKARSSGLQAAYFGYGQDDPNFAKTVTNFTQCLPAGFSRPCGLDSATLWIPCCLHLGSISLWLVLVA